MRQFATAERAWLLQVNNPASREAIRCASYWAVMATVKGSGLKSDRAIRARLGVPWRSADLTAPVPVEGYRNDWRKTVWSNARARAAVQSRTDGFNWSLATPLDPPGSRCVPPTMLQHGNR